MTSVLCLLEDSSGRLWIGTNNDGVILYEDNNYTFLTIDQDIPSYSTRCITETSEGNILVGTALGVYEILPDLSIHEISAPELTDIFVSKMVSFGDNETVGITKSGDIFYLKDSELTRYLPYDPEKFDIPLSVLVLEEKGEEYILLGTSEDYLVEIRENPTNPYLYEMKIIHTENLRYISSLTKRSDGKIWIGTDTGLGLLHTDGQVEKLDYIQSVSFSQIMEDMEGNFWLTSTKEGVLKLTESQFHNITSGLDSLLQINGVELVDGIFYVVSPNGVHLIHEKTGAVIENVLTERYEDGYFRCVEVDLEGNLWFSSYTDDRLIKYNPKTEEITSIGEEEGLDSPRIRSTMVSLDGSIWVATGNGIFVVENEKVVAHYGSEHGMKNIEILSLSQDSTGRVFAGTDGAGVYVIENGTVSRQISRSDGLRSDIILRTETDPINDGTWVVTGNSIAFIDSTTNQVQTIEHFPYNNNFDLLFYKENMIILGSNGIYFTTQKDMLLDREEGVPHLFKNHSDGLFSTPVANSFSKVVGDVLYLCSYQNLIAFNMADEDRTNQIIPSIDLPRIFVNDVPQFQNGDKSYFLESDANYLILDILIPTYTLSDYAISYQIIGYDAYAHSSDYSDFLNPTYTNLPGGTYTLRVDLIDNRSLELVATEEFQIVKEYTLFENPTIRGMSLWLIIALFTFGSHLIFKKRIEKMKSEQEKTQNMFKGIVQAFSKVIDAKDQYTNGHSNRVANYSRVIARNMMFSTEEEESVYGIALLHDVGKIAIPDEVLNKAGRLDDDEFVIMKSHASKGAEILECIEYWSDLTMGAKYHHERYDGKGYPNQLKGEEIPLIARIIGVADSFDTMFSSRIYRKKLELSYVLEELEKNAGTQFDPDVVKVFVTLIRTGQLDELLAELNPK